MCEGPELKDQYSEDILLDETFALYKTGQLTTFPSTVTLCFPVSSPQATWEYPSHPAPCPTLSSRLNLAIHHVLP